MGLIALVKKLKQEQQRLRWAKRRVERKKLGLRERKLKGSHKGDSKGAFGNPFHRFKCPKVWDTRPALKPKEIRELAAARKVNGYT